MASRDDADRVHPETVPAWRAWFEGHRDRGAGVWLVTWRKAAGHPDLTYDQAVEVALAFGWVDSTARKLDEQRTMLWFAPRKARSGWSRPNKVRVARLQAAGLMDPAGQRAVDAAVADGSWTLLDEVEDLVVPPDLAAALAETGGRAQWDAFPPSARRGILEWVVQAKRPQTRAKRIAETAALAARGERANQWTPRDPGSG